MTTLKNFNQLGTISTETDFVLFGADYTSYYSDNTFSSWFALPKTFVEKLTDKHLMHEISFGEIEGKHSDVRCQATRKEEKFSQTVATMKQLNVDFDEIKDQNIYNFFDKFFGSDDWSNFTKEQFELVDEVVDLQWFLLNYSTNKSISLTVTIPEEEVLIFKKMLKSHSKWKIKE